MVSSPLTATHGARLTRQVTTLSVATAAVLVAIKAVVWFWSGSVALLASTADSGLDLIASGATFFAVRYAAAPPDAEHRYGHGKAEAFASLIQAGLVFASAALIGQQAIRHILSPRPIERTGWAIGVMIVSTVLTAVLIAAQTRVLKKTASVAVSADRTHYFADLASNLIALAGIGAVAAFGWASLDALAGLAVAIILLWGAVTVFRQSSNQLMDHELSEDARARIAALMTEDPRISDVHQLRTRASGPIVHIQMHADLDPQLSLIAAHQAVVAAEKRVLAAFPAADIIIHPDPRGRAEPHGGAFAEFHEGTDDSR
ncbi:MAG: cation diffusion facilitator family transporter [Pseudomonadota bacterium]|nr:cation diffusion facilitator family transporter [Pseudomonadota bacterium]